MCGVICVVKCKLCRTKLYIPYLFTAMLIYGNGMNQTSQFYNQTVDFQLLLPGFVLRRNANFTLSVAFPESGKDRMHHGYLI
jgi:hypothetical protein